MDTPPFTSYDYRKNMALAATRLTSKGQVVIPKVIRTALGWRPGARLTVEARAGGVTLRLAEKGAAQRWLEEVAGSLGGGDPITALEAEHRQEVDDDARRRA
jgi:AbrB family looped-hinge helix DNA binding protein